jgi:hypothetical protein
MTRTLEQILSLEDAIVDHYRKNGNGSLIQTDLQREMNLHLNHKWGAGDISVFCDCGTELYADCDSSSFSILEAHFLHVIKVFNIQISEDFEIET